MHTWPSADPRCKEATQAAKAKWPNFFWRKAWREKKVQSHIEAINKGHSITSAPYAKQRKIQARRFKICAQCRGTTAKTLSHRRRVAFEWEERKNFLHPRRSRWADKVTRSTFDRACDALKVSAEEKRVVALCLKQFKPEKKDL